MAPFHRSNTDGPQRGGLPTKASLKSRGSILSHVTSGTWEEDDDIENPHQAEQARQTKKVLHPCIVVFTAWHILHQMTVKTLAPHLA